MKFYWTTLLWKILKSKDYNFKKSQICRQIYWKAGYDRVY